jgi:hypothetical protein
VLRGSSPDLMRASREGLELAIVTNGVIEVLPAPKKGGATGGDEGRRVSQSDPAGGVQREDAEGRRSSTREEDGETVRVRTRGSSPPLPGTAPLERRFTLRDALESGVAPDSPSLSRTTLRGALESGLELGAALAPAPAQPQSRRRSSQVAFVTDAPDPSAAPSGDSRGREGTPFPSPEALKTGTSYGGGTTLGTHTWDTSGPVGRRHQGLILHVLCPRLADAAYPWIMHPRLSATVLFLYFPAILVSTLSVLGVLPTHPDFKLFSLLTLPSTLQRCLLADFEILSVLWVHFEVRDRSQDQRHGGGGGDDDDDDDADDADDVNDDDDDDDDDVMMMIMAIRATAFICCLQSNDDQSSANFHGRCISCS